MATQAPVGELEIGLLRMFLSVADHGSIGKAAEAADMTQPGVSHQMLRLERIVGHTLFQRGRNGVTLTRHGEMLVTYANRAVELNEETLLRLREHKVGEQIVIGTSADFSVTGILPGLRRLQTIRPELELKVVVHEAEKLNAMLRAEELDIVVTSANQMSITPDAAWQVSLQWAARKNTQLDKSRPLPLVLFDSHCAWRSEVLDSLGKAGFEWRVSFESPSLDAILTATQSGLGITLLPLDTIRKARLACVGGVGLPPAPVLEFGMFSTAGLSSPARTVLEVAKCAIPRTEQPSPSNY